MGPFFHTQIPGFLVIDIQTGGIETAGDDVVFPRKRPARVEQRVEFSPLLHDPRSGLLNADLLHFECRIVFHSQAHSLLKREVQGTAGGGSLKADLFGSD